MPGALGLTLLVCVAAVGLMHLALCRPRVEHTVGLAVVGGIAFPLLLAATPAAVLLMLSCGWSRRLAGARVPRVPDRLPPSWR
ncbi:MAG: hypothetical protein QOI20_551 [Acidimicrobiaceae bacterium]|jgi:hypothetical protein|nr:hypothetical protein [Acidimicrobiaceae bacterium]